MTHFWLDFKSVCQLSHISNLLWLTCEEGPEIHLVSLCRLWDIGLTWWFDESVEPPKKVRKLISRKKNFQKNIFFFFLPFQQKNTKNLTRWSVHWVIARISVKSIGKPRRPRSRGRGRGHNDLMVLWSLVNMFYSLCRGWKNREIARRAISNQKNAKIFDRF